MGAHALLSPSGASRWLACPPSVRLEQQFPSEASIAASEGTLAHRLAEYMLLFSQKRISKKAFDKEIISIKTNELYNQSMHEYIESYTDFVLERFNAAQALTPDAKIFFEEKFDLGTFAQESFGTVDVVIVADNTLEIIDLKYGKGVPVYAENNPQMMMYALGALRLFGLLYSITTIRMTIYQPRIDNITTWETPVANLLLWADVILIPGAQLAFAGTGEFKAGKHCQFCRCKAACKANADYNLSILAYEFRDAPLLTPDEIADILEREDTLTNWLSAVKLYALSQALGGKKFPKYKLVAGRSNRKIIDEEKLAAGLVALGYTGNLIYKPKALISITDMEKLTGKKVFNAIAGPYITKSPGAPTLVSIDDKRPEYSSAASAEEDFKDIDTE